MIKDNASTPYVNFKNISRNLELARDVVITNKLMNIKEVALVKNVMIKAM